MKLHAKDGGIHSGGRIERFFGRRRTGRNCRAGCDGSLASAFPGIAFRQVPLDGTFE